MKKKKYRNKSARLSIPAEISSPKPAAIFSNVSVGSFFKTFKASPVATVLISIESNSYLEVNKKSLELFECTRKRIIGSNPDKLGLWPDAAEREMVLKEYAKRKGIGTFNFNIKTVKGNIKNILFTSETIEIDNKKYLLGQILDNTERKLSEQQLRNSENQFRGLIENSRDVIYRYDLKKWKYEYVSPSSKEILGVPAKTFIIKEFGVLYSILHKDEKKKFRDHFKKVFYTRGKNRKSFSIEYRIKAGKKGYKWIADNHTIIYDKGGAPVTLIGNISDITRMKSAEDELNRSFEKQREYLDILTSIQDALPAHIALLDKEGNIIAVNESWRNFAEGNLLVCRDYCVGTNYLKVCDKAKGKNSEEARSAAIGIRKVLKNNAGEFIMEYPCHAKQEKRWFRLVATPVNKEFKEGVVVMHINITDKMLAELALKESEKQYKTLFEEDLSGNFIADPRGKILLCNPSFASMFGFDSDEDVKRTGKTPMFSSDRESKKLLEQLASGKSVHLHERELKLSGGKSMTVIENLTGKYDKDGRLMNIQGFVTDISGVKKAEKALKLSEEQYRQLFYGNPLPMWILDNRNNRFIAVNNAALKHYGFTKDEFLALKPTDIRPRDEVKKYLKYTKELDSDSEEYEARKAGIWKHKKKNGELIDVEITRTTVEFQGKRAILILVNDITERIIAETALLKRNKEISHLYKAGKELSKTLDPDKIYDSVHNNISEMMPCDSMAISSFDEKRKLITCEAAWIFGKRLDVSGFSSVPFNNEGGIQSRIIKSGGSRLYHDFEKASKRTGKKFYYKPDGSTKENPHKKKDYEKSAIFVPLKLRGKVVGVIQVKSLKPNAYTENDVRIVESLAVQLAASTSNALLYKRAQQEIEEKEKARAELKKRSEEQDILFETSKELSSSLDFEEIYGRIYKTVSRLMPCQGMGITSFEPGKKIIRTQSLWADGKRRNVDVIPEFKYNPRGKGVQSKVIRTRKSLLIEDFVEYSKINRNVVHVGTDNKIRNKELKGDSVAKQSILSPLISENKVIGVIQVQTSEKDVYTRDHIRLLEALAAQASSAIMNARLYDQAQKEIRERLKAQDSLKMKNEEVLLLYDVHKELTSTLVPEIIYRKVYRALGKIMPCDAISVMRVDRENNELKFVSVIQEGRKHDVSKLPGSKIKKDGKGILMSLLRQGTSRIINDYINEVTGNSNNISIDSNGRMYGRVSGKTMPGDKVTRSAMFVPVRLEEKIIGLITVYSYKKDAYKEENLRILEALSTQLAAATVNATLYQQAQKEIREKEEAQEALKKRTEELNVLYEAQKKMSSTLELGTIYDNIYKIVTGKMACDSMIISSYNREDRMISVLAVWAEGIKPEIKDFPRIPLAPEGHGIQSRVIRSGKAMLISDYKKYFRTILNKVTYTNDRLVKSAKKIYSSGIIVPMHIDGVVIGTIQVFSYKKEAYSGNDLNLLEALTPAITAATLNARLYEQAQTELNEKEKAQKELAEKNREITRLYEAGREISGSLDLEKIFGMLYKNVSAMIPCDSMIISRYNEADKTVSCSAAWVENTKHDVSKFPVLSVEGNVSGTQGEAIRKGRSIIVNNFDEIIKDRGNKYYLDTDGNVINYDTEKDQIEADRDVTKSAMFIPMKLGKRVLGVISVFSYDKNAYSEYDLRILESISAQVTVTAANAELYARAKNEIRQRKKKEEELKKIRKNMEEAQRIAHLGNWVYDIATDQLRNSEEINRILGIRPANVTMAFDEGMQHVHDEDRETTIRNLKTAMEKKVSYMNEDRIVRPDGEVRFVRVMGEPVFNEKGEVTGMQGTMQDITDVKRINDELVRSLNEKEMMLKEIHHRVKNNLQVVSSLLRLQSEKITDKTAVEYFKLSEQRVKSMALIHQQLYKTRDLSRINFREYLRELCTYLFFVNGISAGRIQLKLESEDLFYGIDIALPCGLIINELITNSLKHAFPEGRKGVITVSLKKGNDGYNYLMVSDDGIGSKGIDPASTKTLGLELVNTLTEQIEGKIEMTSVNGTCTKISFLEQDTKKKT